MSNASKVDVCVHGVPGYSDCDECSEDNVCAYIARRVAETPTLLAADVLAEIRAGKVYEVSPEQHAAALAALREAIPDDFKLAFDEGIAEARRRGLAP